METEVGWAQLLRGLAFYGIFSSVYTLIHISIYFTAAWAFDLKKRGRRRLKIVLGLLILAPAFHGLAGFQVGFTALLAYLWMGLAFYLFLGSELLLLVKKLVRPQVYRAAFIGLLAISVGLIGYGFFEARSPLVRTLELTVPKLPPDRDRVVLAVISDAHLGSVEDKARLERILKGLSGIEYDLLISLGDLIEVGLDRRAWEPLADRLAELKPELGKLAVTGNHEYYTGRYGNMGFTEEFHEKAGFRLLRQAVHRGTYLDFVGLDDDHYGLTGEKRAQTELKLLKTTARTKPVILLKHKPKVFDSSLGLFDLQLAGHTHGGQMWPFNFLVDLTTDYLRGLFDLGRGSKLYVTTGTGTWGPPLRIATGAEITRIVLRAE